MRWDRDRGEGCGKPCSPSGGASARPGGPVRARRRAGARGRHDRARRRPRARRQHRAGPSGRGHGRPHGSGRGTARQRHPAPSAWALRGEHRGTRGRSGPGRAMGPGRGLARRRDPRRAPPEREDPRLGLRRRRGDRDVPRPRLHAGHRLRPRHRHPHARVGRHRLQHLLRGLRAPHRRLPVHRGREQERAAPGDRPDAPLQPDDQRLEPRSDHGGRPLVPVGDAAHERRDADHGGRAGHAGGAADRRHAADAEHRGAQPAAVPLARRRTRRPRLLLGAGSDDAEARPGRRRLMAGLRPARRDQSQLREPRGLRHRQDAGRRRRGLLAARPSSSTRTEPRPWSRPPRRWRSGGVSTTSRCSRTGACLRHRRQLDRRVAHRHERRRLQRGALGSRDGPVDDARGAGRDAPVPLDRGAAPGRARALVWRRHLRHVRPRSATSRRTPRSSRRRTCSRRTAPGSSRRAPRSPALPPRSATAPPSRSTRRTRPRSRRSGCSASRRRRTRSRWSSGTSRSRSRLAPAR